MFCRMCGEQIPDYSETCPVCGEEQHMTTTREMEKGESTDKTPVKILKGAGKAIGKVGGSILIGAGAAVVNMVSEEVKKGLSKKVGKASTKVLKAVGLKSKTPFDKASEAVKAWQKKGRK